MLLTNFVPYIQQYQPYSRWFYGILVERRGGSVGQLVDGPIWFELWKETI